MSNAQFALLAAATVASGGDYTDRDTDRITQRADMFKRWLDQQDREGQEPAADMDWMQGKTRHAVDLPPPVLDLQYCSNCSHPWGYHHDPMGCTMPVVPGTSTPITRAGETAQACGCQVQRPALIRRLQGESS